VGNREAVIWLALWLSVAAVLLSDISPPLAAVLMILAGLLALMVMS
jgi:hypothetical protein